MSRKILAQEITAASQQYTIFVSFVILFAGVFGHIIDILVFTSTKTFRKSQSAFYLTTESIVNCIHLLISFSSRIAINGFNNDLTLKSLVWCKLRNVFATSCTLISLTIVCFAAIDQYLSTNYDPFLKQLSTLKLARRLVVIAVIIWTLHGIPLLVLVKIQSSNICGSESSALTTYLTYVYYLILTGFLPIIIMSIFAVLAYSNVRRIVRSQRAILRRKLDKQLTAMILVRVAFLVAVTIPYVIQRMCSIQIQFRENDLVGKAIMQLIGAITVSFFYLNYAGSFYLFLISSARFRRQVKYVLIKKYWRTYCRKSVHGNRIIPISHISSVEFD